MIYFILYDNDSLFRSTIESMIELIMFEYDSMYEIKYWNDKKLIDRNHDDQIPRVYIIDIDSVKDEGLKYAQKIRSSDLSSPVIFHIDHLEKHVLYIIKNLPLCISFIDRKNAHTNLSRIISSLIPYQDTYLCLKSNQAMYKVFKRDILYIYSEKETHRVCIVTTNMRISIVGSLAQIKELLDDRFIYSHRSCLINIEKVLYLDKVKRTIGFIGGSSIDLLSGRSIKKIEEKLNILL